MSSKEWHSHDLDYPETFADRRPVLDAANSLSGRWQLSSNGKSLEIDLPLSSYSPHERAVIEFALNPYETARNIFVGLDKSTVIALATAIGALFGPNGKLTK